MLVLKILEIYLNWRYIKGKINDLTSELGG